MEIAGFNDSVIKIYLPKVISDNHIEDGTGVGEIGIDVEEEDEIIEVRLREQTMWMLDYTMCKQFEFKIIQCKIIQCANSFNVRLYNVQTVWI